MTQKTSLSGAIIKKDFNLLHLIIIFLVAFIVGFYIGFDVTLDKCVEIGSKVLDVKINSELVRTYGLERILGKI